MRRDVKEHLRKYWKSIAMALIILVILFGAGSLGVYVVLRSMLGPERPTSSDTVRVCNRYFRVKKHRIMCHSIFRKEKAEDTKRILRDLFLRYRSRR